MKYLHVDSYIDLLDSQNRAGIVHSKEYLIGLAKQMSAKYSNPSKDAVMVLNSGMMPDGVADTKNLINDLVSGNKYGSIITINRERVDVSKFLQSDAFKLALRAAVIKENKDTPHLVNGIIEAIMDGTEVDAVVDGKRVKIRQPDGIWDDASRRFVLESASKYVRVMVGGAVPDSVFALR